MYKGPIISGKVSTDQCAQNYLEIVFAWKQHFWSTLYTIINILCSFSMYTNFNCLFKHS